MGVETLEPRQLLSMVFQWNFDEGTGSYINDSSGNFNNGNIEQTAYNIFWVQGKNNSGILFDSTQNGGMGDGSITTTSALSAALQGTSSMTAWVKTTAVGTGNFWDTGAIAGIENTGGGKDIVWGWLDNTGRIALQVSDSGSVRSASPINDGNWHHIAMTRDSGTGDVNLYVDGYLNATAKLETGLMNVSDTAPVGFSEVGALVTTGANKFYWQGALDDFQVYNNVISNTDVNNLFNPQHLPPGGAPTGLQVAQTGGTQIKIQWNDNATMESGYKVERADSADGPWVQIGVGIGNSYVDTGLTNGTTYYYRVKAFNSIAETAYSNTVSGTTLAPFVGTGTGLYGIYYDNGGQTNPNLDLNQLYTGAVITRIDKQVDFDWGNNAPDPRMGADQFSVKWLGEVQAQFTENYTFYTLTDDGAFLFIDLNDGMGFQEIIHDATYHGANDPGDMKSSETLKPGGIPLVAGQKYKIMMGMFEDGGGAAARLRWSSFSTARQAIPMTQLYPLEPGGPTPTAPSGLSAAKDGTWAINLNWSDNSSDELYFSILRATDAAGPFTEVAKVAGNTTSYKLQAEPNTTYYFKLRAYNGTESGDSNVASATTDPQDIQTGILGMYYDTRSLDPARIGEPIAGTITGIRVDPNIAFDWGDGNPWPGVLTDGNELQVHWEGVLIPETTGDYQFGTSSDDGIRVWVDGILASEGWFWRGQNANAPQEWGTTAAGQPLLLHLVAGQKYPVVVDMFEGGGGAGAHVWWRSDNAGVSQEKVPSRVLKTEILKPTLSNLAATSIGPTSVTLTWDDAKNETRERVEVSADGGATWTVAASTYAVNTATGTITVKGLEPAKTYKARVVASHLLYADQYSNEFEFTTADVPPGVLNGNVATPAANTNLTTEGNLDWIHWGFDADAAGVTRKVGGNAITNFTVIGTATAVPFNVTGKTFTWTDGLAGALQAVDVTAPGDTIVASSLNSPAAEGVTNAIDNNVNTKYLNFDEIGTGFTVTITGGAKVINGISLTSANDAPERDPANFLIEGSTDNGVSWKFVAYGDVPIFSGRFTKQTFTFANSAAYSMYRVTFPNVVNAAAANSMQIAEVELLAATLTNATNTDDGVSISGAGNGFAFSAPASETTVRRLNVYVAAENGAQGQLTATLSDGSVVPFEAAPLVSAAGQIKTAVYTLEYQAGIENQKINVEWKALNNSGSVVLQAADFVELAKPAAVTNLSGTSLLKTAINLTWQDNSGNEQYFRVERSLTGTGGWTTVGNMIPNVSRFSDRAVTPGTTYYYRVVAGGVAGDAAASNTFQIAAASVPSPWAEIDIGILPTDSDTGDAGYSTGTWGVKGGGNDIWNASDQFHYVYQPVVGDFRMTARVLDMEETADGWAKAGVMYRESLDGPSRHFFMAATLDNQTHWQGRDSSGVFNGGSIGTNMRNSIVPQWVRLERKGGVITAYFSTDGVNWTVAPSGDGRINPSATDFPKNAYIGLAVTSHNNTDAGGSYTNTSQFDNVLLEDLPETAPTAPSDLLAVAISQNRAVLVWKDNADNELGYRVQRSDGFSVTLPGNSNSYVDQNLQSGVNYSYTVTALGWDNVTSAQAGPKSITAGAGLTTLPAPWLQADVGAPTNAGSSGVLNNVYDVSGAGDDIWTNWVEGNPNGGAAPADQFQFAYKKLTGNFTAVARIIYQGETNEWAKTGLMIRALDASGNLDTNWKGAPTMFVGATPIHGVQTVTRWDPDNWMGGYNVREGEQGAPAWVKMVREDTHVMTFTSLTGEVGSWTMIREDWLGNIGATAAVGLATTSHNAAQVSLAVFDNVSIENTNYNATPEYATALTTIPVGPKAISLNWSDNSFIETGYKIQRSLAADFSAPEEIGTVGANQVYFLDTNREAGTTYYYRVIATNTNAPAGSQDAAPSAVAAGQTGTDAAPFENASFPDATGWDLNGNAVTSANRLRIVNDADWIAGSAFYGQAVDIKNFKTTFDIRMSNANGADGMAFVLQANAPWALGWGGGDLGYGGLQHSMAVKFDIYNNVDETGVFFNGQHPDSDDNGTGAQDVDLRPFGIDLDNAQIWRVTLSYDGTTLTQTMALASDPTNILFTKDYVVDIPGQMGTESAFVGFTAANGGLHSRDEVVSFKWGETGGPLVVNQPTYLKRDGDNVLVFNNTDGSGTPAQTIPFASMTDVVVTGGATTANLLVLDGDVLPASGLQIAGGKVKLQLVGADTLTVEALSIATGASLDLGTNDLIVKNAAYADIAALVASARAGSPRWSGAGIGTTAANADQGLALNQVGADVKVKFTWNGDLNLDGRVNADDYFYIDQGFLQKPQPPKYHDGDFNFDGKINADDYFLIDQAFLNQGGVVLSAPKPALAETVTATKKTAARKSVFSSLKVKRHARKAHRHVRA